MQSIMVEWLVFCNMGEQTKNTHRFEAIRYTIGFLAALAALVILNTQYVQAHPYSPSTVLSGAVIVAAMIFTGARAFLHWEEMRHA